MKEDKEPNDIRGRITPNRIAISIPKFSLKSKINFHISVPQWYFDNTPNDVNNNSKVVCLSFNSFTRITSTSHKSPSIPWNKSQKKCVTLQSCLKQTQPPGNNSWLSNDLKSLKDKLSHHIYTPRNNYRSLGNQIFKRLPHTTT